MQVLLVRDVPVGATLSDERAQRSDTDGSQQLLQESQAARATHSLYITLAAILLVPFVRFS